MEVIESMVPCYSKQIILYGVSTVHKIKILTLYPHHSEALISTQDCKVKFHFLLILKWLYMVQFIFQLIPPPPIHDYISLHLALQDNTKYSLDNANILWVTAKNQADKMKWPYYFIWNKGVMWLFQFKLFYYFSKDFILFGIWNCSPPERLKVSLAPDSQ